MILPAVESRPWKRVRFSPPPVPTMLTGEEQQYLYWLGAFEWSGAGNVVEIGPWLGGSTVCLAEGMLANARRGAGRLYTFDSFIWRHFMTRIAELPIPIGASFEPLFRQNVARYGDLIVTERRILPDERVQGDPMAESVRDTNVLQDDLLTWDPAKPIEILFIDGAKSWTAMCHLLGTSAASLIPEQSLIVCQDYQYWGAYWMAIATEFLEEHFSLEEVLPFNTVTFRLRRAIPKNKILSLPRLHEMDVADTLAKLRRASSRLAAAENPLGCAIVDLAGVRFLVHRGRMNEAEAAFRFAERHWPPDGDDRNLEEARAWLGDVLGRPLAQSIRHRVKCAWRRLAARYGLSSRKFVR